MNDMKQTRRVTIRLTPWQARKLWELRTKDLPAGSEPRGVTEVIIASLFGKQVDNKTLPPAEEEPTLITVSPERAQSVLGQLSEAARNVDPEREHLDLTEEDNSKSFDNSDVGDEYLEL
jgi:hypothetical protein